MEQFSEVAIDIINDLYVKCIDYDTKYTPLINAVNKLQKYEDDEENGLIFRLPCRVGTTIYVNTTCDNILLHKDDYFSGTGELMCPFENNCDEIECCHFSKEN